MVSFTLLPFNPRNMRSNDNSVHRTSPRLALVFCLHNDTFSVSDLYGKMVMN
jgi:hypothetical protein